MKPIATKAQIRSELENQILEFLQEGGEVKNIPRGESGHLNNYNFFANQGGTPPPQARTPVGDALKALDERKGSPNNVPKNMATKVKSRKKQLITDDFGEPLRWVWIDN